MKRSLLKRLLNRWLHMLARLSPGATTIRPWLHRMRGVQIGRDVFIGDDVYLENEHPEMVEIHDGVQISVRAIILAHTRGCGKIVIEKNAYIGPNTVVATSGDRVLRIGEGAVIGAGVIVTASIPAQLFVATPPMKAIANALVPLTRAERMEDFVRGLRPIRPREATKSSARRTDHPTSAPATFLSD